MKKRIPGIREMVCGGFWFNLGPILAVLVMLSGTIIEILNGRPLDTLWLYVLFLAFFSALLFTGVIVWCFLMRRCRKVLEKEMTYCWPRVPWPERSS